MHARKQSDDLRENSKDGSEENEELGPTVDSDKIKRLHAKGQQGLAKGGRSFEEVHKDGVVAPPGNVDNKNKFQSILTFDDYFVIWLTEIHGF